MRAKSLTIAVAVLIAASHFSSCSKPENAIVGKWQEVDGTENAEFFKDGTVSLVDNGMSLAGNYKFIENDRLRVDLGGVGALIGPMIFKVEVSRNELTLTDSKGKVTTYRRAN